MTHNIHTNRCPNCERLKCICTIDKYNRLYFFKPYYEFQPGDGTRYSIHLTPAQHGGIYVIVNESSTWRYHSGDTLKFLCGNNNKWTQTAVFNFLEAQQ